MADNGSLYSGLGQDTVHRLRHVVAMADITVPNYTEACYLTDTPFQNEGLREEQTHTLVDAVRSLGAQSVLITSCRAVGEPCVIGYNASTRSYLSLPYREVPVQFHGTGDIFTAMLISKLLKGKTLTTATQITMEQLSALIDTFQDVDNKAEGLPY